MGFNITASDIEIHVSPTKLDNVKTRIDIPLLLAKNVKISNGGLINLSYNEVDLGSVYGVYEKNSDKIRVHVNYCCSKICSIIGSIGCRYKCCNT